MWYSVTTNDGNEFPVAVHEGRITYEPDLITALHMCSVNTADGWLDARHCQHGPDEPHNEWQDEAQFLQWVSAGVASGLVTVFHIGDEEDLP